jgi:hypothetical protein
VVDSTYDAASNAAAAVAAAAAAAANKSASRQQQAAAMLQLLDGVLIDAGVDDQFGELFNFGEMQR